MCHDRQHRQHPLPRSYIPFGEAGLIDRRCVCTRALDDADGPTESGDDLILMVRVPDRPSPTRLEPFVTPISTLANLGQRRTVVNSSRDPCKFVSYRTVRWATGCRSMD